MTLNFATILDALKHQAALTPKKTAFTFQSNSVSYQDFLTQIEKTTAYLHQTGIEPGQNVLVALPNGPDFFNIFFGCQQIGVIPIPITPSSGPERINSLATLTNAKHLISQKTYKLPLNVELHGLAPAKTLESSNFLKHRPNPEDVAYFQITSGSTGTPKAVIVTHQNLMTNINQMIAGMQITKNDIFVTWLPVYHDMGLILMALTPFALGFPTHILPTTFTQFNTWLETIQSTQGTFTAAPDFAYRLLVRLIRQPKNYSLSSLRLALNAAEPVRAKTVQDFHEHFELNNVMAAGYGLAEATVGVSMSSPGHPITTDAQGFVSVGPPFPDVEIKVFQDDKVLPNGETGEIAVKSTANTLGYFNQTQDTQAAYLPNGYILTGDLGYLDKQGHLTIIGRKKNIIKHMGRTIAPKEIEEIVDQFPEIRYSAALGIDSGGFEGEQIYIFAELRHQGNLNSNTLENLHIDIVNAIHQHIGSRPARIYFLKARSIPKTHNGKIKHQQLRLMHQTKELDSAGFILYEN